jgi:hypothetical protein
MGALIWVGAVISLLGVGALVYCIVLAVRARKEDLDETQMMQRLQRLAAYNMGALAVAAMGLMMVVIGILLG